ncbi:hypothetical protein ABT160_02415 [Streptomyces sp. NPDC001941]|uniref:hypothetical protein n=1 Tax=Streptomyces sp. NPDC001941 TaxID=3154659 RepID=UPI00331752FF
MPATEVVPASTSAAQSASDVVRWAAFSCALVPVVLVVHGTSFGGASVAALGLAAVTAACRVLLRQSERAAAREAAGVAEAPHGRRRSRDGGTPRGNGRRRAGSAPQD